MLRRLTRKTGKQVTLKEPAEDRYRTAFEQGLLAEWFCDTELRLIQVNAALCELLGRRPGGATGQESGRVHAPG